MKSLNRILVAAAGVVAVTGALRADTVVQGSVRAVPLADATAIGGTLGCRVYQVTGPVTTINANTPECMDQRCIRTYSTNAIFGGSGLGGYNCNQESTGAYGPPPAEPSNQTFYEIIDARVNPGTINHIGFYAVQGQSANNNSTDNAGDARRLNCAGTVTQNCFTAADPSNADPTPIQGTMARYPAFSGSIRSIGGLSPVPVPRVPIGGPVFRTPCGPDQVHVTWEDPIAADPTMKNGVPSPVLGLNLYQFVTPLNARGGASAYPTEAGPWVRVSTALAPNGEYGTGAGANGDCVDLPVDYERSLVFALTVRLKGPGPGTTSVETLLGANSYCFDRWPSPARIVSLDARYEGRGVVHVSWTSGIEGGIEGYYVTRSMSPAGPFTRVSDLVSAAGDGTRYSFSDRIERRLGRWLYYQIEEIQNDGRIERSGVASVEVPGPKARKLGAD